MPSEDNTTRKSEFLIKEEREKKLDTLQTKLAACEQKVKNLGKEININQNEALRSMKRKPTAKKTTCGEGQVYVSPGTRQRELEHDINLTLEEFCPIFAFYFKNRAQPHQL